MRNSDETIIDQLVKSGILIYAAIPEGDYKTANRENKKLVKIFKQFEADDDLARRCLYTLLAHENVEVRAKAAAWELCLAKSVERVEIALGVLDEVKNGGYKIFSFNAEMTIKVYHEQGYLKVYPEQEIHYLSQTNTENQ